MKSSIKVLFVILAIIVSIVAVQSVCAETVTGSVEGVITSISNTKPYKIEVEGLEISGVRYNFLCNQYNICLETGNTVIIDYYEFECPNDDIKLMAYSITVGDVTVKLREVPVS